MQNREVIGIDDMPEDLQDAVVAAENRSFWTDKGIDPKGMLRAFLNNSTSDTTQGASTITQQYVKILYLSQERSYQRKVKEAVLSLKIQRSMSKTEILEDYLNTIYFGRGAYGVQAASEAYFAKDAKDLSLRESAVLASVINNPTHFDPANGKDSKQALKARYAYVLDGMAEADNITADEAEKAARKLPKLPEQRGGEPVRRPEGPRAHDGPQGAAPARLRADDEIDGGGLRVTTTFTEKAMNAAEEGVAEARPEGLKDKELHVGVASVEPGTGAVRGIFGGQDYLDSQLNWAVAGGQGGSTLKPFALVAAIRDGYSLKDTFDGQLAVLPPGRRRRREPGQHRLRLRGQHDQGDRGLHQHGVHRHDARHGERPGQDPPGDGGHGPAPGGGEPGPATASPTTTPGLEPGHRRRARQRDREPDQHGERLRDPGRQRRGRAALHHREGRRRRRQGALQPPRRQPRRRRAGHRGRRLVRAPAGRAGRAPARAALELGRPAAGKTGTSTNSDGDVVSSWFTGYTPQLSTSVVYVRGKGAEPLDGYLEPFFGGTYPAQTWTAVMKRDMEGLEIEEFPEPVYVDGEAPEAGHSPTTPPPKPTKTPKPTETETPSETPTETPTETRDADRDADGVSERELRPARL